MRQGYRQADRQREREKEREREREIERKRERGGEKERKKLFILNWKVWVRNSNLCFCIKTEGMLEY